MKTSLLLILPLFLMIFLTGCSDDPKGACVFVSGYGCVDDQTHDQCSITGGTHWNEGETCAELGFGGSPVSTLVLSELFFVKQPTGVSFGWIELLNSGPESVDLSGFQIITRDSRGNSTGIVLKGIIDSCGTFVVGSSGSDRDNGSPSLDQVADLSALKQAATMVALVSPGSSILTDCPVSVVCFSEDSLDHISGFPCTDNIAHIGPATSGLSVERESWPANQWRTRAVPDPNFASSVYGCDVSPGRTPDWSLIRGIY